jgi:uncharacterized membrane protein YtjA (UPF0391 family)
MTRTNAPATILFFIFMTLKLTGHIDWSWWWVTAPLWIPAGVVFIVFMILLLYSLVQVWREDDIA